MKLTAVVGAAIRYRDTSLRAYNGIYRTFAKTAFTKLGVKPALVSMNYHKQHVTSHATTHSHKSKQQKLTPPSPASHGSRPLANAASTHEMYKSPWLDIYKPEYAQMIKLRSSTNVTMNIRFVGLSPLSVELYNGNSTEEISAYIRDSKKDILILGLGIADYYRLVSQSTMKRSDHSNTDIRVTRKLADGHYLTVIEDARRGDIPALPLGRENVSKVVSMFESILIHPLELFSLAVYFLKGYIPYYRKRMGQADNAKFSNEMMSIAPNLYRSYFYKDVEYLAHAICVFVEDLVSNPANPHYQRDKATEVSNEKTLWRRILLKLQSKYMKYASLPLVTLGKKKEVSIFVVCNAPTSFSLLRRLFDQLNLKLPSTYHKGRMLQIERQTLLLFLASFILYVISPILLCLYGFWKLFRATISFFFVRAQKISVGGDEFVEAALKDINGVPENNNSTRDPSKLDASQNLEEVHRYGGLSIWYRDRSRD